MKIARTVSVDNVETIQAYWGSSVIFKTGDDSIEITLTEAQAERLSKDLAERVKRNKERLVEDARAALEKAEAE